MNDRENPEVIKYLEEENSYEEVMMKETEAFQEDLYEEMKARYKKDDEFSTNIGTSCAMKMVKNILFSVEDSKRWKMLKKSS